MDNHRSNVVTPISLFLLPLSDLFSGFGRRDVVDHLLQTGANVHARDDGGLIPLHNACSFGHSEVRLYTAARFFGHIRVGGLCLQFRLGLSSTKAIFSRLTLILFC